MKLHRKIFVDADYYKGLNESEASWLKKIRSNLAKKYYKKYKEAASDNKKKAKIKFNLREELKAAELGIRTGSDKDIKNNFHKHYKYVKSAVNNVAERKKQELEKKTRNLIVVKEIGEKTQNLNKVKEISKKALIIGGPILGVGLGIKAIKDLKAKHDENKKKTDIKKSILK